MTKERKHNSAYVKWRRQTDPKYRQRRVEAIHRWRKKGGPELKAYLGARSRCHSSGRRDYRYYGGRGIKFLFTSFDQWMKELGPRPSPRHSVDRINNDGNYEPGNVRWATQSEQRKNSRKKN